MSEGVLEGTIAGAATPQLKDLYEVAWSRFRSECLWNVAHVDDPTPADAEFVARALRAKGDLEAYRLADALRAAARAA